MTKQAMIETILKKEGELLDEMWDAKYNPNRPEPSASELRALEHRWDSVHELAKSLDLI